MRCQFNIIYLYIGENIVIVPDCYIDDIDLDNIYGDVDSYDVSSSYEEENSEDFSHLSKEEQIGYFEDNYLSGHDILVRFYIYDLPNENTYYYGDCYIYTEDASNGIVIKVDEQERNFTFSVGFYDRSCSLDKLDKYQK